MRSAPTGPVRTGALLAALALGAVLGVGAAVRGGRRKRLVLPGGARALTLVSE